MIKITVTAEIDDRILLDQSPVPSADAVAYELSRIFRELADQFGKVRIEPRLMDGEIRP